MCGVFGWIKIGQPLKDDEIVHARKALALLAHRGPDHQGEWFDSQAYLGHRRLSIIDLSPQAHQPFIDETKQYVLIFNGGERRAERARKIILKRQRA